MRMLEFTDSTGPSDVGRSLRHDRSPDCHMFLNLFSHIGVIFSLA